MQAAGLHPHLGADHRGCRIGIEDEGEAIWQVVESGSSGGIVHEFPAWTERNGGYTHDMQRWIVLGALVLSLLGGGLMFGYWKHHQSRPDRQWVPLPFNVESTQEQRDASVEELRKALL